MSGLIDRSLGASAPGIRLPPTRICSTRTCRTIGSTPSWVMWACLYGRNRQDGHIFQVLTKRAQRMRDYFSTDRREA